MRSILALSVPSRGNFLEAASTPGRRFPLMSSVFRGVFSQCPYDLRILEERSAAVKPSETF